MSKYPKTPSYKGLVPASELASKIKKKNTRTDTRPEILLRRRLWKSGVRFRKNLAALPGKPDIVFLKPRVVVFCDGDFWHGRNWKPLRKKLSNGTNAAYWIAKIKANIDRDKLNNKLLETDGWRVIRVWETDLKKGLEAIASEIVETVKERTGKLV